MPAPGSSLHTTSIFELLLFLLSLCGIIEWLTFSAINLATLRNVYRNPDPSTDRWRVVLVAVVFMTLRLIFLPFYLAGMFITLPGSGAGDIQTGIFRIGTIILAGWWYLTLLAPVATSWYIRRHYGLGNAPLGPTTEPYNFLVILPVYNETIKLLCEGMESIFDQRFEGAVEVHVSFDSAEVSALYRAFVEFLGVDLDDCRTYNADHCKSMDGYKEEGRTDGYPGGGTVAANEPVYRNAPMDTRSPAFRAALSPLDTSDLGEYDGSETTGPTSPVSFTRHDSPSLSDMSSLGEVESLTDLTSATCHDSSGQGRGRETYPESICVWVRGVKVYVHRFPHGGKRLTQAKTWSFITTRRAHQPPFDKSRTILIATDSDNYMYDNAFQNLARNFEKHEEKMALSGYMTCMSSGWRMMWNPLVLLQDCEYISGEMNRAFELLCGTVNCLPGGFTAVRYNAFESVADKYFTDLSDVSVTDYHRNYLGEDRYLTHIMHQEFPRHSMGFCPSARCKTDPPTTTSGLVKQRRRCYSSHVATAHTLDRYLGAISNEAYMFTDRLIFQKYPLLVCYKIFSMSWWRSFFFTQFILLLFLIHDLDFSSWAGVQTQALCVGIPYVISWMFISWTGVYLGRWKVIWMYPLSMVPQLFLSFFIDVYTVGTLYQRSWGGARTVVDEKGESDEDVTVEGVGAGLVMTRVVKQVSWEDVGGRDLSCRMERIVSVWSILARVSQRVCILLAFIISVIVILVIVLAVLLSRGSRGSGDVAVVGFKCSALALLTGLKSDITDAYALNGQGQMSYRVSSPATQSLMSKLACSAQISLSFNQFNLNIQGPAGSWFRIVLTQANAGCTGPASGNTFVWDTPTLLGTMQTLIIPVQAFSNPGQLDVSKLWSLSFTNFSMSGNYEVGDVALGSNCSVPALPKLTATISAWIYPDVVDSAACTVPDQLATIAVDTLRTEYLTIDNNGFLQPVMQSDPAYACNGLSVSNAALIRAHSTGQFVTISGGGVSNPGITKLFTAVSNHTLAAATIVRLVQSINFTGVDIDVEQWRGANMIAAYPAFVAFIHTLGTQLHANGLELAICGPGSATDGHVWKWADFAAGGGIDYYTIMAYDSFTFIGDPLESTVQLQTAMQSVLGVAGITAANLVVGIPSYGYWGTKGADTSLASGYCSTESQTDCIHNNVPYSVMMTKPGFTAAATPVVGADERYWTNGGNTYLFVSGDDLSAKRRTAVSLGASHVAVWSLGGNQWLR